MVSSTCLIVFLLLASFFSLVLTFILGLQRAFVGWRSCFRCVLLCHSTFLFFFISLSLHICLWVLLLNGVCAHFHFLLFCYYHRMFILHCSYVHMLAVVAWRCRLPYHSYLCEIAGDGTFLGGVELEISCGDDPPRTTQHFFWAQTPVISLSLYEQAALQALRFLQGVYGFVVSYYNYEGKIGRASCRERV